MSHAHLQVLTVIGSLHRNSMTRSVMLEAAERMRSEGCEVDVLDLEKEPLALYNPDVAHDLPGYSQLKERVDRADVLLLGTPDYHGSISSALKNFLDHFWTEFAGKLFVPIVASHEKGLTVIDQLRTVARQCYAWTLPYAVSFSEKADFAEGRIASESFRQRLEMTLRDARVYGQLLAEQRRRDLAGKDIGFMARHRK